MDIEHVYFPEETLLLGLPVIAKKGTFLAMIQNNYTIILQGYEQKKTGEYVCLDDFPLLSYCFSREDINQGETYL